MAYDTAITPVRYSPDLEQLEADEAETLAGLTDSLRKISETTYADSGHAMRGVHAKCHGLLAGEMTVVDKLPESLRQGLFARPGRYQVILRLSTIPGDILPDKVSTPRGLALKVIGVEGARLPGSETATTQDFVLVNGPAFSAPNAKKFLGSLKMLAKTTDKMEGVKVVTSAITQGVEKVVEALGGKSSMLMTLGGHPETHILGETFYSQVPLRFGDYVAKISLAPVSPALTALTGAKLDLSERPDGLRETVSLYFAANTGEWELRAQLCTDLETMPIEDASVVWPEESSPYVTVARITVRPQPAWDETRQKFLDDSLSFSPWHGIAAHQPLGSVMRARKLSYEMSATLRANLNGSPIIEPTSLDDFDR
ncbi:catalase family protein [Nevskia ramosa]|uniref:catalase family protein n=1 Tax=Nevskia ramosa TaxID=64002 RepID=UPI002352004D|nr:catalase family protein [Nevskia ramosa]